MMYRCLPGLILLIWSLLAFGNGVDSVALQIPRFQEADVELRIDGRLNEQIWKTVPAHDGLAMTFPATGEAPGYRTHSYFLHTEAGLYVGVWNEQPAETLLPRMSSRDAWTTRDGYELLIDSSGEGLYGYWFNINLGDAMGDGIVLPERWFEHNWDGHWRGATQVTEDGWSAEMFLPWSMMNMPQTQNGDRRMGIAIYRYLGQTNEVWSRPYLPSTQPKFLSEFQQIALKGVQPSQQYSIYPYLSSSYDKELGQSDTNGGVDLFWRPSTNFQLSATVNPDFGHVESDNLVVNFSAFETFFPEKRLFFLENQDVFNVGRHGSVLLHTRRIGSSVFTRNGQPDRAPTGTFITGDDAGRPVDLMGAVKVAGQKNKWRYGALTALEDDTRVDLSDGANLTVDGRQFGVFRLSRDNTEGSGRRSFGWLGTITDHPDRRAVSHGLDGQYMSPNGRLQTEGQVIASRVDSATGDTSGVGAFVDVTVSPREGSRHRLTLGYLDDQLDTNDLGFLNRNDLKEVRYRFSRTNTESARFREVFSNVNLSASQNTDGRFIGGRLGLDRGWIFKTNGSFNINADFRPAWWDDRNAFDDGDFRRSRATGVSVNWATDAGKPVVYGLGFNVVRDAEFGLSRFLFTQIKWRPTDRISIELNTNLSRQDEWLLYSGDSTFTTYQSEMMQPRFRIDGFISARQQIALQLQWVGLKAEAEDKWALRDEKLRATGPAGPDEGFVISDLIVQLRYRWQIAPLSDLWLVYSHGGNVADGELDDGYGTLFRDAVGDPNQRFFVAKLRFRFGS